MGRSRVGGLLQQPGKQAWTRFDLAGRAVHLFTGNLTSGSRRAERSSAARAPESPQICSPLGVIMFTWTSRLIYSDVGLLHIEAALGFFSTLSAPHTHTHKSTLPWWQMKTLRMFTSHIKSIFLFSGICVFHLKYESQSLITKCQNKWLHIINNINDGGAPYSCMKQSMRVEAFFPIRIQLIQRNCTTAVGISTPSLPTLQCEHH